MKTLPLIIIGFLALAACSSCYYDKQDLLYPDAKTLCDTTATAKYSTDVAPVMTASCNASGCHNTASASAGVILDTYDGVKAQALNGKLMGSINQNSGFSAMPKNGAKLPFCVLTKIQQWITAGIQNN